MADDDDRERPNFEAWEDLDDVEINDFGVDSLPRSEQERRSRVASVLAIGLACVLGLVVPLVLIIIAACPALDTPKVHDFFQIWLTAVVGLTSTAVAFYFRSESR